MSSNLITISAYSEMVGRPASTIRLMCREGRMPGAVRYGTEWLIDIEKAKRAQFKERGRPKKGGRRNGNKD